MFSIYVKVSGILTWLQKQLSSVASVKKPSIVVEYMILDRKARDE